MEESDSESEVLKLEESESERLCTDSTALVVSINIGEAQTSFF
jgi:hypothetical protein